MANYYEFIAGANTGPFTITAQLLDGSTETATLDGNVINPSDIQVEKIRLFTSMYKNEPAGEDVTGDPPAGQRLFAFAYSDAGGNDLITLDLDWTNTDATFEGSADAQTWKVFPYRKEDTYDRDLAEYGTPLPSPGGEGEQYFNWMFRSVHDNDVVYGVHDCAVPWKTEDNGVTWKKLKSEFLYGQQEQTMLESPDDQNVLFVAMSDYDNTKDYGQRCRGLLRSADRGESYTLLFREPRVNPNDANIVGNRSNEDVLVADPTLYNGERVYYWALDGDGAGDRPFYRSVDGDGLVWSKGNNDLTPQIDYDWVPPAGHPKAGQTLNRAYVYCQQLAVGANHRVFMAADAGLFYSDNAHSAADDAVTWVPAQTSNTGDLLPNWFSSVAVAANGNIYAVSLNPYYSDTHANYGDGKIYVSTDNGTTWNIHLEGADFTDMGWDNDTGTFRPYSLFLHPDDADTAWVIGGPDQAGDLRNFFFDDWTAPVTNAGTAARYMINLDYTGAENASWKRYMVGSRTQVAFYPGTGKKEAIVQGQSSIFKSSDANPTEFVFSQDWFKGENWTDMAFDPYDDTVMYASSEDTSVTQVQCDSGTGRIKWWAGIPSTPGLVSTYFTSKRVYVQGDYLFCNRGYAIGKRKLLQARDRLSPLVEWQDPPGGVDYTNLNPDNVARDEKDDFVPHNFDNFYTHPVTGAMVSGDNVSATWTGDTWTAIPGLRYEGTDVNGHWDSSGDALAISAEVCGMSVSGDDVYLWAVNGSGGSGGTSNVRNQIYRCRWDGTPSGFIKDDDSPGWDKIVRDADVDNFGGTTRDLYSFVDSGYSICAHPTNPNIVWARVCPRGAKNYLDGHLYRYDHTRAGTQAEPKWEKLPFIKDDAEAYSINGIISNIPNPAGFNVPQTQANTAGAILFDPNGDLANGVLYITPHFAAGKIIYRSTDLGDTWTHIGDGLPCLSNTKMMVHPVTGELIRGGCDGTYVHPPPVGYQRRNNYRTLWSRSYNQLSDPTYGP